MDSFLQENIVAQTKRCSGAIGSLSEEFKVRFRDFAAIEQDMWLFSFPFSMNPNDASPQLQLELIELQCDELCGRHQQLSVVELYQQLDKGKFPKMQTFPKKLLSSPQTRRGLSIEVWISVSPFSLMSESYPFLDQS